MVELLVVVAIIMIIASISAPLGTIVFYREKEIILRENLKAIRKALDDYYEFTKGSSRTLELEMEEALYLSCATPPGTRYTADEYWDWQYYPLSWNNLYDSGFLRRDNAVNPFTNKAEDFDIVVAIPIEYIQDNRFERDEGQSKIFNLPLYPDESSAPLSTINNKFDPLIDPPATPRLDIDYNYIPTFTDDNDNPQVKYIFTRDEWHRVFVDPDTGLPRTDASGFPVTFPFSKVGTSTIDQTPVHPPRIFDVRYPEHSISLDGHTYYDQW